MTNHFKKKYRSVFVLFLLFFFLTILTNISHAETRDLYAFKEPAKQVEFETLVKDLRCLVCQGQDLHDSQTAFAETLKEQIHQWVLEGKSEKEILSILTERYGNAITFDPPLQTSTYILWVAPFAALLIVIPFLFITITKRQKNIP